MTEPTERTRVRRKAERGRYDDATIRSVLAEAIVGHVGFVVDGRPVVIPTAFAVVDDHLYGTARPATRCCGRWRRARPRRA